MVKIVLYESDLRLRSFLAQDMLECTLSDSFLGDIFIWINGRVSYILFPA